MTTSYPIGGNPPNQAGGDMARIAPVNTTQLTTGPNPRLISNTVVAGTGQANLPDPSGLSGFMYAFGQFVDHDTDRNPQQAPNGTNDISITVPAGDPAFPPGSKISVTKAQVDPTNGAAVNKVTGWLDLSQVYGSDAATAAAVRGSGGHLLTSAGGNLPIVGGNFLAGDVRAQENPELTAEHTLFVREHNFWVDALHQQSPQLTDDQLFNQARSIVTAEFQSILYSEYLPHLLGPSAVPASGKFVPGSDPRITEEFAGAAFRFGHSLVSPDINSIDNQGNVLHKQALSDTFFESPATFVANGGADGLLRHLAGDPTLRVDVYIINDLRNLLVDPPGRQDLAAINIQRGRDLQLGTLNQTRVALGLSAHTTFAQITSDPVAQANLANVYASPDQVDLWVGGLAEDRVGGGILGQTFQQIIAKQFVALRNGDPLFFDNQNFSPFLKEEVGSATLSDIIVRNTDTTVVQGDAFVEYQRHSSDVAAADTTKPQLVIGVNTAGAAISGGSANDVVVSGVGNLHQTLTGGGGDNIFVFLGDGVHDTISDFKVGHDKLYIGNVSKEQVKLVGQGGQGVGVKFGGDLITLTRVRPKDIRADLQASLVTAIDPGAPSVKGPETQVFRQVDMGDHGEFGNHAMFAGDNHHVGNG